MAAIHPLLKRAMRVEWKGIVVTVALAVGQSVSLFPVALLVNRLFDVHLPEGNTKALVLSVSSIILLFVFHGTMTVIHKRLSIWIVKRQVAALRMQAADSIMYRSRRDLGDKDRDLLHAHVVQDSLRIDGFYGSLLNQFIPSFLISLSLAIVAATIQVFLFAILIVLMPMIYLVHRKTRTLYGNAVRAYHNDFSLFSKHVSFLAKHDDLIHVSSAETIEHRTAETRVNSLKDSTTRASFIAALHTLVQHQLILIGGAMILFAGGLAVGNGYMTTGDLISFYVAVGLLSSHARTAIGSIPPMIEGSESLKRMASILEEGEPSLYTGIKHLDSITSVEFKHVTFGFDGKQTIINNLSFCCKQGETLWLKGPSGCGKTTIVLLLMGFYRPLQGDILINDIPLEDIDVIHMRRLMGSSMQDPSIFSATIRENLVYGLHDVPDDASIMEVCAIVGIDSTVRRLPQGLDTYVGERGMTLSGGERQRLSIARALLRKPQVLILDEPENNLPVGTAQEIVERTASPERIRVIISHRNASLTRSSYDFLSYEITGSNVQ